LVRLVFKLESKLSQTVGLNVAAMWKIIIRFIEFEKWDIQGSRLKYTNA